MKIIAFLIEVFSWLKIVASPLLIAAIIAIIIYLNVPETIGLALSISILLLGLIVGVIWATHVCKNQSATAFLARIYATPELDKVKEGESN
jgi:MFS-type transporter involved in bile tolerance (Atg22 family)